MSAFFRATALLVACAGAAGVALVPPRRADVQWRVDGSAREPISRYIYGLNFAESRSAWGADVPRGITLSRMGGNRLSAYNWETNASNCGNDCNANFNNDGYLGGGAVPGEAVRSRAAWAASHGAAFLATVPMLGFVAGDSAGAMSLATPVTARRANRFVISRARKGAPPAAVPNVRDGLVHQDEFVAFLERAFPAAERRAETPLWYSLDNEPDIWGSTHEAIRGNCAGPGRCVLTGYDELADLGIEYASAVKGVAPAALVFGPVLTNWNGFTNLFHNDTPDPAGRQFYLAYYLNRMRAAEQAAGRRLLDVLDVHWYAEAVSARSQSVANEWAEQDEDMIQARVQAPRSLWDPGYRERSWVTRVTLGPIRLIPRLRELIAQHYPGTRIAITEYFYHRGGDISGALAQADALGIFGREGVFAATLWPQGSRWAYKGNLEQSYACVFAAFRAFRDYDGHGAAFGDISLGTTNPDVERTSVYASVDAAQPRRMVVVALNKSAADVAAKVTLANAPAVEAAAAWRVTGTVGRCTGPVAVTPDPVVSQDTVALTLPPLSITTLVLNP
ncbi:MAG: endoglucanase A [Deltaproteobacteria bacterium]|nr:endoglucanase A [Deltaproteobacteria bacterium]